MQENPLKAEVRSADDQQRINVIVKQSTTFKRTLLQVTGGWVAGWAQRSLCACVSLAIVSSLLGLRNFEAMCPGSCEDTEESSFFHLLLPGLIPPAWPLSFFPADITMLGDSRSVAKLLLPAGATVLDVEQITVEQPPRDTGTVLGVIQRDPVNYYRCWGMAGWLRLLPADPAAVVLLGVCCGCSCSCFRGLC